MATPWWAASDSVIVTSGIAAPSSASVSNGGDLAGAVREQDGAPAVTDDVARGVGGEDEVGQRRLRGAAVDGGAGVEDLEAIRRWTP